VAWIFNPRKARSRGFQAPCNAPRPRMSSWEPFPNARGTRVSGKGGGTYTESRSAMKLFYLFPDAGSDSIRQLVIQRTGLPSKNYVSEPERTHPVPARSGRAADPLEVHGTFP